MKQILSSSTLIGSLMILTVCLVACRPVITTSTQTSLATTLFETTGETTQSPTVTPTITNPSVGSTEEVLANGGPVVQHGSWLYFPVAERQALRQAFGLYRIQADGTDLSLLYAGFRIQQILIIDDWLYFVQSTTVEDGTPVTVQLVKCRLDGSDPATLLVLDGWDIDRLIFSGGWIYLGCTNESWQQAIFQIRTDGSERTEIVRGYSLQAVSDEWIYALSDMNKIIRLDLNGRLAGQIGPDIVAGGDFLFYEESIYYSSQSDRWNLYRIRSDGTDRQQLTSEPSFNIRLDDGKIIYQVERTEYNMDGSGGELVRISLDGSGRQTLGDVTPPDQGMAYLVSAMDGWLYLHEITFHDQAPDTYRSIFFRMKTDFSARTDLISYDCINAG